MQEVGIQLLDYLLLPFFVTGILMVAYRVRNRLYPAGHPWRRYFIPGLVCKMAGAILFAFVYWYYYGSGDTIHYFHHSRVINESLVDGGPLMWAKLILRLAPWYDADYSNYISRLYWYDIPSNYQTGAVGAIFGVFTFNTYLNSNLLFAALSFSGIWAMFRCFVKFFPQLLQQVAIATLFIPSLFFWGSGFSKDSICMFALGWAMYLSFELFYHRKLRLGSAALLLFSLWLLFAIKVYLLISLVPALLFWMVSKYSARLNHPIGRSLLRMSLVSFTMVAVVLLNQQYKRELRGYSLDNLVATSQYLQYWQGKEGQDREGSGSFYSLGEFDPTFTGLLLQFPKGVNVTLFRPYFWEAKKAIVLISAVEAFLFLFITLKVFFSVGLANALRTIFRNIDVQFFLIFTLIFAFAIGVSTLNFGTLSRYKIPCMPTFLMALLIIFHADGNYNKRLFPRIKNFI